jgi:hypothetical protein
MRLHRPLPYRTLSSIALDRKRRVLDEFEMLQSTLL